MGLAIYPEVEKLVNLGRKVMDDFGLKEYPGGITPEEIEQFKKYYPDNSQAGKAYNMTNPEALERYKHQASKILDFMLFDTINDVFEFIKQSNSIISVLATINKELASNGANSLARYMGPEFVPQFVDDEKMFKKMLWLEWVLEQAHAWANKFLTFMTGRLIVMGQLNSRLQATKKFVDQYVKEHPDFADKVKEFRATYHYSLNADYKQFGDKMDEGHIAAMKSAEWMRPGKQLQKEELPEPKATVSSESTELSFIGEGRAEDDIFFDLLEEVDQGGYFDKAVEENPNAKSEKDNKQDIDVKSSSESHSEKQDQSQAVEQSQAGQEFLEARIAVIHAIKNWIAIPEYSRPVDTFYILKTDIARAQELLDKFANISNLVELKNELAIFIKEGQTKIDKTVFTYSRLELPNTLRNTLASLFCPDVFKDKNSSLIFFRRTVSCNTVDIVKLFKFPTPKKDEKSKFQPGKY